MNVGLIGLGTMGAPMALNLLKAGHYVTVHNRRRDCEAAIAAAGAQRAESPEALAAHSEVILICVSDSPDVEAVVLGDRGVIHGAAPGSIVVDLSTISPKVTRRIAAALAERQVQMLDGPVSGGSEGAQQGSLSIMVGGEAEVLARALPVLSALGQTITHVGPIGAGQVTKAINQVIIAGTYLGIAEGMALGMKAGLDMGQVVQAVGGGAAGSWGLNHRSGNMIANHYPLGFRLRLHHKDLKIALEVAEELGVTLPIAAHVAQLEAGLIARGFGDEDLSAIARAVREPSGLG
ncbi:MAG: NAD(P)-dependent oxidoreductase [Synechococcales cyanobacterium RM1_1_8]|nr:NAD(P)-dependent oxidoreductase [Synechococcales cyanobacterium RM1_1_8]